MDDAPGPPGPAEPDDPQPRATSPAQPASAEAPVAVGIGANLGDRRKNLERALAHLDALDRFDLLAVSPLYESAPWGDTDQEAFLNAVVLGRTTLAPADLLARLVQIELAMGKQVVRHWGPRNIDLDLLLYGQHRSDAPELTLPHPHIRSRPFVYLPLRNVLEEKPELDKWSHFTKGNQEGQAIEAESRRLDPESPWPSHPLPRNLTVAAVGEEETVGLGHSLGRTLTAGWMVALKGPLGAGKSCVARGIARGLGIEGPIASPTYTLCREYRNGRLPFLHWDFYRLRSAGDLESSGFAESLEDGAVCAIEWADLFRDELPSQNLLWVDIERPRDPGRRTIRLWFPPGSVLLRAALSQSPGLPWRHTDDRSGN